MRNSNLWLRSKEPTLSSLALDVVSFKTLKVKNPFLCWCCSCTGHPVEGRGHFWESVFDFYHVDRTQVVKLGCKHCCLPSRLTNPVLYFSNFLHAVCPSESPLRGPGVFQLPFSENRGSWGQYVADSLCPSVTPMLTLSAALGLLSLSLSKYTTILTRKGALWR